MTMKVLTKTNQMKEKVGVKTSNVLIKMGWSCAESIRTNFLNTKESDVDPNCVSNLSEADAPNLRPERSVNTRICIFDDFTLPQTMVVWYSHEIHNVAAEWPDCFPFCFLCIYNSYLMIDINGISSGQAWPVSPARLELYLIHAVWKAFYFES